jgi:transmembrane sensor
MKRLAPLTPDTATTRQTRDEQAISHLIALEAASDVEAQARAEAWIEQDPANAVAFARARAAWRASGLLRGHDDQPPVAEHPAPALSRRRLLAGAMAACAGLAVVTGAGLWWRGTVYSTQVGEIREVGLPDGSRMTINSDSAVEVAYRKETRALRLLRGEAFFDVAHNPSRPFEVSVGDTTFRALGTAFNLRDRGAVVELAVSHGLVGVREGASIMRQVPADHFAIIHPDTVAVMPYDPSAIDQKTAWRNQTIELNGDSVAQAVEEFNRYRTRPIIIGDQRVGSLRVGGRFPVHGADQFIEALEAGLPVHALRDADGGVLLLYNGDDEAAPVGAPASAAASGFTAG